LKFIWIFLFFLSILSFNVVSLEINTSNIHYIGDQNIIYVYVDSNKDMDFVLDQKDIIVLDKRGND
jgi:hypothetical protein